MSSMVYIYIKLNLIKPKTLLQPNQFRTFNNNLCIVAYMMF